MTLAVRSDAVSHVGKIRANNQDSGYAGNDLFVVADGMGGYAGGDVASAIAISVVEDIDKPYSNAEEAQDIFHSRILDANTAINETVEKRPELARMGTTLSGLLRVGKNHAVIAHIGDSRIYRYRDGKLEQISVDHTFVQRLVESGRITPEEALVHPRRSVVMKVLGDVEMKPEIDFSVVELKKGDRWLLCSDGLSGYVPEDQMFEILQKTKDLEKANQQLLDIALSNGAPDNVTSVLVEFYSGEQQPQQPIVVGSASDPRVRSGIPDRRMFSLGMLRHPITAVQQIESRVPEDQASYLQALIAADRRRERFRKLRWLFGLIAILALAAVGLWFGYQWTQQQYYVGVSGDTVAIYQGIPQDLGSFSLSEVIEETDVLVDDLQYHWQNSVRNTFQANSLEQARQIVMELRTHVKPE